MNRIFKVPDKGKAEVDVLAVRGNHLITAIAWKGYSPRATIPEDYKNLPIVFEFWTSAPIGEESLALFETAKVALNGNRYMIALRGPADVAQICWDTNEVSLINAFEKHFMLEDGAIPPLARPRMGGGRVRRCRGG